MNEPSASVQPLGRDAAAAITRVLCESFAGYPVMRFVLGTGAPCDDRLERLVGLFVLARVLRGEPLFGIREGGDLVAAAIASYPGRGETPAEFARLRTEVFSELGPEAQARYESFGNATRPFDTGRPHVHLNMVGVLSDHRGLGLGRLLIERVQQLSLEDAASEGVSLTTEDPANVPYYERLGYQIVGHARVAPDLETWGFYRPD